MKKFIYFLFGALVVFMAACSEDTIVPPKLDASLASRATTPHTPSELNPSLLTDWENCDVINLSVQGNNGLPIQVTAPWKQGASTVLLKNFATDIKKCDGWIMLFHTFCKQNLDPALAYLCLYNRFTGAVKFMYYSNDKNDQGTHTSWSLSADSDDSLYPFFADYQYFSQAIDGEITCDVNSIMVDNALKDNSGLTSGWNGFEIRMSEYSPGTVYPSLYLRAYNTAYSDYTFLGKTEETTTGTISTLNTSDKNIFDGSLAKAALNLVGDDVKGFVDSFAKKNLDKNFLGINFANILSKVSAGDYVSAISSGLSSIFKLFFHSKPSYSVSDVSLKTEGTVNIEGNQKTYLLSCVEPFSFDLNQILSGNSALTANEGDYQIAAVSSAYSATTDLGVWTLKKKPTLYYERYTKFTNLLPDVNYEADLIDFNGTYEFPSTSVADVEVVFNPSIRPYIKSYYVTTGMIDVVGGNRYLNNRRINCIKYNPQNYICQQGEVKIYGIDYYADTTTGYIYDLDRNVSINGNTDFYVDWGEKVAGNRAAVITLTMNIEYNGQSQTVIDSRVYDVDYLPNPNGLKLSTVNNPPQTYLLNHGPRYSGFGLYQNL